METKSIKIVVYHCRNLELFKDGGHKEFARSRPGLRLVAVPCSGKVEAHHILGTMAGGADGVLILACAEKACKFLEGSMRAHKRLDFARRWLTELNIEPERIEFVHATPRDKDGLTEILNRFGAKLDDLGAIAPASNF